MSLLNGLHRLFPRHSKGLGLVETLTSLRREGLDRSCRKLLIVLDQFEQWLHAKKDEENTELVQALRQCDGSHMQCLVMVRDDFWLAVSRFMLDLEIDIVPGHNVALVDLFPMDHARGVLAAYGRAFARLPEVVSETTQLQKDFLNQALADLPEDGKVVPVRLSLFADMMKHTPWSPAALRKIGGAAGIGVTFLEEAFSSRAAFPRHRLHEAAARRVLEAMLPDPGTNIKGHMVSRGELLHASGYGASPGAFTELIHFLDSELRLITPTDS